MTTSSIGTISFVGLSIEAMKVKSDKDSEISFSAEAHGRLGEKTLDLANAAHVEQVKGQVNSGDSLWCSIPCTERTQLQHMSVRTHGSQYKARLKKRQARVREMLRLAIGLAARLSCGVRVAAIQRVVVRACLGGIGGALQPPKMLLRGLCFGRAGDHAHEHAEGHKTKGTGHDLVMEVFFPKSFYKAILSFAATPGYQKSSSESMAPRRKRCTGSAGGGNRTAS